MKDYNLIYQRLTQPLRHHPWTISCLRLSNSSLTKLMYALYPSLLLILLVQKQGRALLISLVWPALSFLLVSLLRSSYNRPRPYESWPIQPLILKETKGQSLPSRHVFSAVLVSLVWYQISPSISLVLLLLSACLAICRVLGGVHYPSDVLLGYLLGLMAGLLTLVLI